MIVASLTDLTPIDHRIAFPNTSFADTGPDNAFLTENGYTLVFDVKPYNSAIEKLVRCVPYLEDSVVYTVKVIPKTQEDLDKETAEQAEKIREQRDVLLLQCDWTQLPDSPVDKDVWANYRQSLRDITTQSGFPWSVLWPVKP